MFNVDLENIPRLKALMDCHEKHPEINVNAVETCWLLLDSAFKIIKTLGVNFSKYNVSDGKFSILIQLYLKDDYMATPSELSANAKVTKSTITGLLDGLEKDNIIERRNHKTDRRMVLIKLTNKGINLMNEIIPIHFNLLSELFESLGANNINALRALLETLILSDKLTNKIDIKGE